MAPVTRAEDPTQFVARRGGFFDQVDRNLGFTLPPTLGTIIKCIALLYHCLGEPTGTDPANPSTPL